MQSGHPVRSHVVQDPVPIPPHDAPQTHPQTDEICRARAGLRARKSDTGAWQVPDPSPRRGWLVKKKTAAASRSGVTQRSWCRGALLRRDKREKESNRGTKLARREDVTPVERGPVLPCAPPETSRLFSYSVVVTALGRIVLGVPSDGGVDVTPLTECEIAHSHSRGGSSPCQVPAASVVLPSDLAGDTTRHRPTPCPACYQLHTTPVNQTSTSRLVKRGAIMTLICVPNTSGSQTPFYRYRVINRRLQGPKTSAHSILPITCLSSPNAATLQKYIERASHQLPGSRVAPCLEYRWEDWPVPQNKKPKLERSKADCPGQKTRVLTVLRRKTKPRE